MFFMNVYTKWFKNLKVGEVKEKKEEKIEQPKQLEIIEYPIINESIPESFDGFKIVHFSDIHFGTTVNEKELESIVNKINLLKPDILVFTGDLFDNSVTINENTKNKICH